MDRALKAESIESPSFVDLGRFLDESRKTSCTVIFAKIVCSLQKHPPVARPAWPQQLVNRHDHVVGHLDQLGSTLEILSQRRPPTGSCNFCLKTQRLRGDTQVFHLNI